MQCSFNKGRNAHLLSGDIHYQTTVMGWHAIVTSYPPMSTRLFPGEPMTLVHS